MWPRHKQTNLARAIEFPSNAFDPHPRKQNPNQNEHTRIEREGAGSRQLNDLSVDETHRKHRARQQLRSVAARPDFVQVNRLHDIVFGPSNEVAVGD